MSANQAKLKMGEFTIGSEKYQCGTWDVDTATETLTRLVKLLGEPIVMVLMGVVENKQAKGGGGGLSALMDTDIDDIKTEAIAKAFQGLAMRLHEDEVKGILKLCCGDQLLCNGKPVVYNEHFMGRIGHLLKVSMHVLRHQYQDFLGGNPGLAK